MAGMFVSMADLSGIFGRTVLATQAVGYTMPGAVRPAQFTEQQDASIQRSYDLYTQPTGAAPPPEGWRS